MQGSKLIRMVLGDWIHIGTAILNIALPASGVVPRGTHVNYKTDGGFGDLEFELALATGNSIGFLVQDVTAAGIDTDAHFKELWLLQQAGVNATPDMPVKMGAEVSVRALSPGAEIEVEGVGTAASGNLLCTSGTGALANTTPRDTEISVKNGSLYIAQEGDFVQYLLKEPVLTVESALSGAKRMRFQKVSPYLKPTIPVVGP